MAKNKLTIKVDADTQEALTQMRELTEAANECVAAFEKLEKVMNKFNNVSKPINIEVHAVSSSLIPDIVPSIKNSHFLRS